MVIYENLGTLTRAYSDAGVLIHGGLPEGDYTEAIDPTSEHRVYTETDIPITPTTEEKAQAYDILTGGAE